MLSIPASQLYDLARAHIASGLTAGGVRVLWDQFPTGKLIPVPYDAFRTLFGPGWKRYKPWDPPFQVLMRPEGMKPPGRKIPSLTFAHALEAQVIYQCHFVYILHIISRFPTRRFVTLLVAITSKTGWTLVPFGQATRLFMDVASASILTQVRSNLCRGCGLCFRFLPNTPSHATAPDCKVGCQPPIGMGESFELERQGMVYQTPMMKVATRMTNWLLWFENSLKKRCSPFDRWLVPFNKCAFQECKLAKRRSAKPRLLACTVPKKNE